MTASPRIGWIGLGSMGLPMATNLQKHLSKTDTPDLIFYNRTISRGDSLKEMGGRPQPSPRDLVDECDLVFLSLSDDAALKATLDAIFGSDPSYRLTGKTFVDTSTVHPDSSFEAQTRLAEKGASFVAAPVFGASPVAAQGRLLWIVAGHDDAVSLIKPYIDGVMGRGTIHVGEDVRQASMMKTTGNFITAGMMEVIAEAHVLAEKSGLGSKNLEALIEQQYGPLAFATSQRLTTGAYMPARGDRPWSDLELALKDVGHGVTCAEQSGTRLKVAEVALDHLKDARGFSQKEGRPLDSSSLYGAVRQDAGLSFETDLVKKRDEEASKQ
ncbi:hypothetical protein F5X68DRAFT_249212 [Plectosphaerella plurivora]|uniref:6-phosphogluconate dehydrogenase NADP-binding domain-containing protein n=1 Tax=Plectosphaerella plurivora TaxID=936078 RepID=A0A9P8V494_9PEZI|nr:hypothetical protein F5X68DRAFT_249212 [Plectosphaerella plurivora]